MEASILQEGEVYVSGPSPVFMKLLEERESHRRESEKVFGEIRVEIFNDEGCVLFPTTV